MILLSKHSRLFVVDKRGISTTKVLYAIFISCDGIDIQVPVQKSIYNRCVKNVRFFTSAQHIVK